MENQHPFLITIKDTRDGSTQEIPCDVACCVGMDVQSKEHKVVCAGRIRGESQLSESEVAYHLIYALRRTKAFGNSKFDTAYSDNLRDELKKTAEDRMNE